MRIAQLAGNVEKVPPDGYGGTELVVNLLTEELVKRGHEVTLFASGDSCTEARLVSVVGKPLRTADDIPRRRWQAYDILALTRLREMIDQFDIVHNHMGWQALPWAEKFRIPMVTTNHNLVKKYCEPIYMAYKDLNYVAISEAYRQLNYPHDLNYVATIYNGIDTADFAGAENGHANGEDADRKNLLFIGRICNDKGTAEAIEFAQRVNMPLVIAGKVDSADQVYFEQKVKPQLDNRGIKFVGEVSYGEKIRLYKEAVAVVYPINFEEPFGLVMAEALAAGAPVLAFKRGSVPELLTDRETAIVGTTVDDLVARFPEARGISSQACRKRAEMFSKRRMVDAYQELYERLIEEQRQI